MSISESLSTKHTVSSPSDTAGLIVTTYDRLGLLEPFDRDILEASLPCQIADLRRQHGDTVEPFLAVNLSRELDLNKLMGDIDDRYKTGPFTIVYKNEYWDQQTLSNLNRRQAAKSSEIGHLSLRGALISESDVCDEPGLRLTDLTIEEQRSSIKDSGAIIFSPADWLLNVALRKEQGLPMLDTNTITLFPLLRESLKKGNYVVGNACAGNKGQIWLLDSQVSRNPFSGDRAGIRFSVGLTDRTD